MLGPEDNITLASKLLQREDFWMRELCSIYPYGLNDNVKGLGNISKLIDQDSLVVYSLFHKHDRKFRNRNGRRSKNMAYNELIDEHLSKLLAS